MTRTEIEEISTIKTYNINIYDDSGYLAMFGNKITATVTEIYDNITYSYSIYVNDVQDSNGDDVELTDDLEQYITDVFKLEMALKNT